MSRITNNIAFLIICVFLVSCGGDVEKPDEPLYEKVIAPASDVPADLSDGSSSAPNLDELEEAVQAGPDDPFARFAYMNGLKRAGKITDALDQARLLAEMEGENPFKSVAYLNFAQMVLDDIPVDDPDRDELIREAMDGLWIALGWEPESIPAHLNLGRLALESGDDDKALHHLAIALTVTEIGHELRIRMAEIYIERDDFDKSRAHLEVANQLAEAAEDDDALKTIKKLTRRLD